MQFQFPGRPGKTEQVGNAVKRSAGCVNIRILGENIQNRESAGTAACDQQPFWICQAFISEIFRQRNRVFRVIFTPMSVEAFQVTPSVPGRTAVIQADISITERAEIRGFRGKTLVSFSGGTAMDLYDSRRSPMPSEIGAAGRIIQGINL